MPVRLRGLTVWTVVTGAALGLSACSPEAAPSACDSRVIVDEVPAWASTGFTPGARVPHVVGADGRIVAVMFADRLMAAEGPTPVNKVLFVPREPLAGPSPLRIDARLEGTGPVVRRERVEGPGPGSLDLPTPGCWRLVLTWADQRDTLDLRYE